MHEILLALAIVLILIYLYHQCSQSVNDNIIVVEKDGAPIKPKVIITEIVEEDNAAQDAKYGVVCEYEAVNDSVQFMNNAPKATHFPSAIRPISAK